MNKGQLIIVLLIIVVLIGGGIFFLTRSSDDENSSDQDKEENIEDTSSDSDKETDEEDNEVIIDDSFDDSNFSSESQTEGDSEVEDATITNITNEGNENYYRIIWDFEEDVPSVEAEIDPGANVIKVLIYNLAEDNSGIGFSQARTVDSSVVTSIVRDTITQTGRSQYSIGISQLTTFYLHEEDGKLILDVREVEDEENNEPAEGESFDNEFSTDKQYIKSSVEDNPITITRLSYNNQGDIFRIVLDLSSTSDVVVPNVEADLMTSGENYEIRVVVSNLDGDYISGNEGGSSQDIGDDTVERITGNFSDNQSIYSVALNNEAEYKIYASKAPAELVIDIKRG